MTKFLNTLLFNALKVRFLEAFDAEGIHQLVSRADNIDPSIASEVIRQGGGHPFIIQHILHYLIASGIAAIRLEHVSAEVRRFCHDRSADLDGWWNDIGEDGRRIYYILRQSTNWMTLAEIIKTANDPRVRADHGLTALAYHGLIIHDGTYQRYSISGELFRELFDIRFQAPKTERKNMTSEDEAFPVFICYAHKDNEGSDPSKRWLDCLSEQLEPLALRDYVRAMSDKDIEIGNDWHESIHISLQHAKAAVLLVSPVFLASKYIRSSELPVLLMNSKQKGVVILPIVLRHCLFNETTFKYPDPINGPSELLLSSLQSANAPSTPLNAMNEHEQDRILLSVAQQLLKIVQSNLKHISPETGS